MGIVLIFNLYIHHGTTAMDSSTFSNLGKLNLRYFEFSHHHGDTVLELSSSHKEKSLPGERDGIEGKGIYLERV